MAFVPTLAAQFPDAVQPGRRVRVWLPESNRQADGPWHRQLLRGTVEVVTSDTLRVTMPAAVGSLAIPRESIRHLEVSRGEPSSVESAFERAIGGAIAGAIVFAVINDPQWARGPHYNRTWRAAEVGAQWGALTGFVTGFVFPYERWRSVRLQR